MRVGPFRIERDRDLADDGARSFAHVVDPDTVTRPPTRGSVGSDGESAWQGMWELEDEPRELVGHERFPTYNAMRRSDPAVKSSLWMLKLPIRRATWSVKPASDDPTDELVAEAVRWNFGLDGHDGWLDLTWDESLTQALLHIDWGAMFEEIIWGDPLTWKPDDGEARLLRPINRLAPRYPVTVREIETDTIRGGIRRLTQDVQGARPIPGDKLAWYVLDREGTSWMGTSMLRSMFGPWKFKRAKMISEALGYDRFSSGIPIVRYPAGGGPQHKREAEQIGANTRVHERAYVVLEGGPEAGWDFDLKTTALHDAAPMLRYYDEQIAAAAVQQFSKLGTTTTGSRAVASVLDDPFYLALEAISDGIAGSRRRRVLRRFVDVNFGPEVELPRLTVSNLQSENVETLARVLADLTSAGFNFTDIDTQEYLRDIARLPPVPEAIRAAVDAANEAGAGVVPFVPQEGGSIMPGSEATAEADEQMGLLAQRLGLAVKYGIMSQEEAREELRKRGLELGGTVAPVAPGAP